MDDSRPILPEGLQASAVPFSSVNADKVVRAPNDRYISATLWTCGVCMGIPRNPVMLRPCGHVGCDHCTARVFKQRFALYDSQKRLPNSRCPVCRTNFIETDMVQYRHWELLSKGAFNCVEVACTERADAGESVDAFVECKFVGSIQELREHELRTCENRTIQCPNPGCVFISTHNKLREHFKSCDKLVTYCNMCNMPRLWIAKGTHSCIPDLRQALFGKAQ